MIKDVCPNTGHRIPRTCCVNCEDVIFMENEEICSHSRTGKAHFIDWNFNTEYCSRFKLRSINENEDKIMLYVFAKVLSYIDYFNLSQIKNDVKFRQEYLAENDIISELKEIGAIRDQDWELISWIKSVQQIISETGKFNAGMVDLYHRLKGKQDE